MAVLGLLTLAHGAQASVIGQVSDSSTNILVNQYGQHIWDFTPDVTQTINSATIYSDGTFSGSGTLNILDSTGNVIASSSMTLGGSGIKKFLFPSTILASSSKYAIQPIGIYLMGSTSNLDSKGCKEYAYMGGPLGTCGIGNTLPNQDIYLSVGFTTTITPFLTASSTMQASNDYLDIGGTISNSVPYIHTQLLSETNQGTAFSDWDTDTNATTTISIPLQLPAGEYWIKWYVNDGHGSLTNITPNNNFTFLVYGTSTNVMPATTFNLGIITVSTSSSSTIQLADCSGFGALDPAGWACWTSNTAKTIFAWFLYPNQSFFDLISDIKKQMTQAFPLSFVYGAYTDVATLYTAPTTTPDLIVSMPFPQSDGSTQNMTIFSMASTTAMANTSTTDYMPDKIKTAVGWFLWIEFIISIVLFWKIKPQLHS